ncbi:RNA polymerase III RPC4-domain-containing protein [Boeremia exigua]|uniref:RNA polymerase III RPC4-domain-containing protein n=1 Tax=Boeremia exigua TaxID=749465 RepID=UPI001E8E272A|nr:RNA polymerase III RPC4-domain-containing protein [Boeremia exigua]KAH6642113.1 RNA polymerase III RPC4-domain-containing protein [Boeremia exigua]
MPPKPRGRASTRARAGGRGGATAGRAVENPSEAVQTTTPPTFDAPAASETADAVVTEEDNNVDTKPPSPTGNESTPNDTSSATATPQDGAEASTRPPVQRLGGLKSAEPTSRSSSPSVKRGTTKSGKKTVPKPMFTARRSKEERAALEKEQLEREKIRHRDQEKEAAFQARRKEREAAKEATRSTRGRGGYSSAMSGPFSLGSSKEDRKTNHRNFSGFGAGSGSRAVRVKNEGDESGPSRSGGYGGGGGGGGGGSSGIKREDGGVVESSEDEEDQEFPRRDIDLIEISDDEDGADVNDRPSRSALPIRITRKEHQEKALALNTDASAETAPKSASEATGTTGGRSGGARSGQGGRKGKGKASDLEITGVRKPFKGVWQDAEDSDVQVKSEQTSDDEQMADAEQVGLDADQTEAPHQETPAKEEPQSPTTERKGKSRTKSVAEPVLQTDEDRAEWSRFLENRKHIRAELGPEDTDAVDAAGDTAMADGAPAAPKPTVRDNNVYLFQIPPLMPELIEPGVKKDMPDVAEASAPAQLKKEAPKIKVEEGFSDPAAKPAQGPRFASGLVGKLRVRQSGRTTLDWGGTSYELAPGNKASFLQEVVSIHLVPEKDRVVPEDAGEAVSFGRVKGKFVVTPDWGEMLG